MIDSHAIVDPSARLAPDVTVGPWSLIGPDVEIGPGCIIEPHVVIRGPTVLGGGTHVYQFSSIGEATPDLKYRNEPTRLVIGQNNVIRENVTIHRGTIQGRSETTIGNSNLI
ncbi:MAG: UDP-N-acetylglucosamine acyltransferase, partial [Bacteroidia bacterium]